MTPYFDVSHLPSSTSFYSAVLQPLGIHYISTDSQTAPPDANANANEDADTDSKTTITTSSPIRLPSTVTYGILSPLTPIFQIREARNSSEPLKLSRAVFSASSPTAVTDFHAFAVRANPNLLSNVPADQFTRPALITQSGDIHRATVTDLDGNTMEVVYQPPPNYPPSYAGSTVRKTQSTTEEAGRILDWNYDVAASEPPPPPSVSGSASAGSFSSVFAMAARSGTFPGNEPPYTMLRRSVTTSVIESPSKRDETPSQPSPSSGITTNTLVGSLLGAAVGAAAGAAVTYGMMRKERARAPRQEFDGSGAAPPFQRRATFPDQYADPQAGRYVEVERTVEKIRYPEAYPALADNRAPPQYMAKYSQVGARSRAADDLYDDTRSRASSRYQLEGGRGSSVRSRSQAAVPRTAPLMLTDYEHQSNSGSRHSIASRSAVPRTVLDDAGTYVSARSGRSQSTVRPPPPSVETILGGRSQAPSRAPSRAPTMAPSLVPSRAPTKAPSMAPSRASSRAPSRPPTVARSRAPTVAPSRAPSMAPSQAAPTVVPSKAPSRAPSRAPTRAPSRPPTVVRNTQPVFAYPPATRAPTYVSARAPPPPKSRIDSGRSAWEDDAISVAPSDSISCIGSKTSRRQYH
ncbi:hypothetical protein BDP55DRAFT_730784 [Colletotrichum godetiae]|uniref:Glyoxalase family protein n=1 Tax=Colletotrichum godetiae TaxID=1209918 RepID=A0AAJ0AJU7_9PEZI|nr:uncharacterized protein BDP55DRAFT_730784 [Colletotrichum godetiae]KAK1673036.1 hypothetical protein BDP55DRAFT_730784 [Colletotrichum godetiae]